MQVWKKGTKKRPHVLTRAITPLLERTFPERATECGEVCRLRNREGMSGPTWRISWKYASYATFSEYYNESYLFLSPVIQSKREIASLCRFVLRLRDRQG